MARHAWKVRDKVVMDTGRHQYDGVIIHISTIPNNMVPYTVEFKDDGNNTRTRNCSAGELSPR